MAVQDQLLAPWCTALVLHVAAREAQARRAHAIADHEDQVTLSFRMRIPQPLGVLCLLVQYSQDDYDGGGYNSPDEESNLPPEAPCPRSTGSLCRLSGQKSVLFGQIARVVGGSPACEKGPVASHDGGVGGRVGSCRERGRGGEGGRRV